MAGILAARVVAVFAELDTGKTQVGSGYLLDARRVLTARHCAHDKVTGRSATSLRVSRASDGSTAAVTLSEESASLDMALLTVTGDPPWGTALPGGTVTFGKVDRERTGQLDDCEAAGYPLWQASESGHYWDVAELHGYIYALEGRESKRLVLREPMLADVGLAPGDAADGKQSAWAGLSGAAVFHDGLLLGVIIEHHPRQGLAALQVRPVEAIMTIAASAQAAGVAAAGNADTVRLAEALALAAPAAFRQVGSAEPGDLVVQLTADGLLPAVSACNPFTAGVVRTSYDNSGAAPYVTRDVDEDAIEPALRDRQLVVLLGPSAAGKSRTAMQAARRLLPGYSFLQPAPAVALRSVLGRFSDQQVLVWLDDLDRFVDGSQRGLTVGLLDEIAESKPGWKLLATLRTDQREAIAAEESERSRALRDVLGAATVIRLQRSLSNAERVRVELAYPDEDFRGGVGLGERLIAGPELRSRLLGAANPLGAMLCRAAIDLEVLGLAAPLRRADLIILAPAYMAREHPGVPAESFDFDAAFTWATAPLVSHVSLLASDNGSPDLVRAADYVAASREDLRQGRWIPEETWAWAIEKADPAQLRTVTVAAAITQEWRACAAAATRALQANRADPYWVSLLGRALHRLRDYPAAVRVLSAAARAGDEVARAHALTDLADAWYVQGQPGLALHALQAALTTRHAHSVTAAAVSIARIHEEQIRSEQGNPVAAVPYYQHAARVAGECSERETARQAWRRVAELLDEAGDLAGVAAALMQESQYATGALRDSVVLFAGRRFKDAGDAEQARSCFDEVLENASEQENASQADKASRAEHVATAAAGIAALIREHPADGQPDLEQAAFYYRLAIEKGAGEDAQIAAIHLSRLVLDTDAKRVLLGKAASGSHPKIGAWGELLLAQLELEAGNRDAAVPHLDAAFDELTSTTSVGVLTDLAETMKKAGQAARAAAVYNSIVRVGTMDDRVKAGLERARLLRSDGNPAQAVALLRQLEADGDLADWRDDIALELASAPSELGQRAEVITMLTRVIGDRTDQVPLLWRHLATAHFDEGHYDQASECTRHFADSPDPFERVGALWLDAECQLALGDTDAATRLFTATTETGRLPFAASAHAQLSEILADQDGNEDAVIGHCRAAMRLGNPHQAARAAERLAVTLHAHGRTAEGIAELAKFAPTAEPGARAALLLKWAQLLGETGKPAMARRKYQEALAEAIASNQDSVVTSAGDGLLAVIAAEDWAERAAVYEAMLQHADRDGRARAGFDYARQLAATGQLARARVLLADVIASDAQPYAAAAWLLLAEVMWIDGDAESAPAALAKADGSDSPWAVAHRPMIEGEVRLGLGDADGAIQCFQQGAESDDPFISDSSRRMLGLIMDGLGRDAEAVDYLERARASASEAAAHQATLDLAEHYAKHPADPGSDKAIGLYQELAGDPTGCLHTSAAALRAGELLADRDRDEEASALLRQALRSPQQAVAREARYILAITELNAGESEPARRRLTGLAAVPDEPFGLAATFSLAVLDSQDGAYEAALGKFTLVRDRAEAGSQLQADGELGVADALIDLGRHEEAYPALLDLCDSDLQRTRTVARLLLGDVYRHRGSLSAAAREYQAALAEVHPSDDDIRVQAEAALDTLAD